MTAAAAHYGAGRLDEAADVLRRLETADPANIDARYALAVIDTQQGRWAEARSRFQVVIRRRPTHFGAWHNLGVASQGLNDWEGAARAYAEALAAAPTAIETAFSLAVARAVLGDIEGAAELYRRLAGRPDTESRALARLAILQPAAITDANLARLRALADAATARTHPMREADIAVMFGLAGVLEARGRDDEAWAAYSAGNAMKHLALAAGPEAGRPAVVAREHAISVRRIKTVFTAEFLAAHADEGDGESRPIFIVGMPRSGSSLIEQILASHPAVQGMGESGALWSALDGRYPYPPSAPRENEHLRRAAGRYLAAQRARGLEPGRRLVDKTLDNHLHIGMIQLMFPRAVILHVRREPLATGLACFRQLFSAGNETLYDLADIGQEMRRYDEMMAHWRLVLPGRVTEVLYEDLVTNADHQIRWLVGRVCGLPWNEACLNFHRTNRAVGTASAGEVRRPMFTESLHRRSRFDSRLEPLAASLAATPPVRS